MILKLIKAIDEFKFVFIEDYFKSDINNAIKNLLPLLNNYDLDILYKLTLYMIEDISIKYNFNKKTGYNQWKKNNNRDISSLVLTLIPYIGDNNYNKITKLTDIIFNSNDSKINKNILLHDRKDILKKNFPYSNFTLGLLNEEDDFIFDLYATGEHTIYHCIENNFVSMLETIKITNGKLYVNWINIIPMVNYKKSHLYKTTLIEVKEIMSLITPTLSITDYYTLWNINRINHGLYLGEYYNVIANAYYNSVKNVKWLLFCTKINDKYFYILQYLSKMINLDIILLNTDYYSLSDSDKNKFNKSIENIIECLKQNRPIYLDIKWEYNILKNIMIFMISFYSNYFLLDDYVSDEVKVLLESDTNDLELGQLSLDKISNKTTLNCFEKLEYNDIFTFLKEAFNTFKLTPYAKYLLNNNSVNMSFFNLIDEDDKKMNLKNLYNIAKSLCHKNINEGEYLFIGNIFKNLSENDAAMFYVFYFTSELSWINIRNNIALQENDNDINIYNNTLKLLSNAWNKIKIDLPWEYLSENGLLSEFNINFELTDNSYLNNDTNIRNKLIKQNLKKYFNDNPQLFTANYFLTNRPYNELKSNNKSYIDKLTSEMVFYTYYANDWLSQINYFNHYINHSVIYVTGSTGTGKSTQIPKLTLYALKMYDYKNNGKIVCTQPRIPPTVGNAKQIAKQMGVDIFETKFNTSIEYKTELYYIQYKHSNDNHTKKYNDCLTLTMMTDGSLLESLITNPLMKKQILTKNTDDYVYSNENIYDIVMVDEAHEHNTNMDLILTLMRQTCIYNNSIRLIIVSATMDDDEPIYRSYYKLINDNIVHPIKQPLVLHPLLGSSKEHIDEFFVNSYYLDRRVHISIPKEPFPYTIYEYYDNEIEKLFTSDMKKNADIAQKKSYQTVLNICNKSDIGDILLFSIGEEDIKNAVNELNRIIPTHVIALPFYSRMNSKYKEMIEDIDKYISKIRNNKYNIANEWGEDYIEANDVPSGYYKRAVIVATNVAEASITIDTLRYVIDTGYAKANIYSIESDSYNIVLEQISESSRIQRRGRVGRVAEGHVYHIYGRGTRENVKIKYKITTDFIYMGFLKLLTNKDSNIIWEPQLSPYLYNNFYDTITKYIRRSDIRESAVGSRAYLILLYQFLICYNPPEKYYFYPFNEYQQNILPNYLNRHLEGFNYITLTDLYGDFYIIHPYEYSLTRNIMGNIIKFNNKIINKINPNEYKPLLYTTKFKLLLMPHMSNNTLIYIKTIFHEKINEITSITKLSDKYSVILFLLSGYDMLYEGCEIISMLNTINSNISSLILNESNKLKYEEILKIFGSDSDLTSIYNICKLLKHKLKDLIVYEIFNNKTIFDKYKYEFKTLINEYNNNNFYLIKDSLDVLNSLKNNGRLDSNIGYLYWLKSSNKFKNILRANIINNKDRIIKICNEFYLNSDTILEYFENLIDLTLLVYTINIEYDERYNKINPFDWAKKLTPSLLKPIIKNTPEEKINLVFFISQPLYFSVMFDTGYKNMYALDCSIKPLFKDYKNTLVNSISNYIGYVSYTNNQMSIIFNIDITKLSVYFPIYYNNYNIKNFKYDMIDNKIVTYSFNNKKWDYVIQKVRETISDYNYERFLLNNINLPNIQQYLFNIHLYEEK